MSEVIGKVADPKLSDGAREAKLWRSAEKIHLRDGTIWNIVKVLVVTRYTIIVRVDEGNGDEVKLFPKHAVDRVDMKKQGEIQAV